MRSSPFPASRLPRFRQLGARVFSVGSQRALAQMSPLALGLAVAHGLVSAAAATVLAPPLRRLLAGAAFGGAVTPTQAELALVGYLSSWTLPGQGRTVERWS